MVRIKSTFFNVYDKNYLLNLNNKILISFAAKKILMFNKLSFFNY